VPPDAKLDGQNDAVVAISGPGVAANGLSTALPVAISKIDSAMAGSSVSATVSPGPASVPGAAVAAVPNDSVGDLGPADRSNQADRSVDNRASNAVLTAGGFGPPPVTPIAGAALAGALASALEAALPSAITVVVSADAIASFNGSPQVQSGTVLAGGPSNGREAVDAFVADTAPKDETAESTPTARGSVRAASPGNAPNVDAREPIRLHAEWSDQGVSVWLGSDANETMPLVSLMSHVQQWLSAHGERLRALVWNGRAVPLGSLGGPALRSAWMADTSQSVSPANSPGLPDRD
jgi:hypothetical protein